MYFRAIFVIQCLNVLCLIIILTQMISVIIIDFLVFLTYNNMARFVCVFTKILLSFDSLSLWVLYLMFLSL
jgi:hypothetical protein